MAVGNDKKVKEETAVQETAGTPVSGAYDKSYTAESAKGYIPVDTTTTNNSQHYAERAGMSAEEKTALEQAGIDYNTAKDANDQAGMAAAHERAEAIRGKYGYSGGVDGSELRVGPSVSVSGGTGGAKVDKLTNRAPDLTGLLDSWLASSKQQQENKIDYAVQQGVTDLQRAEEDAQQKFQTQQDQVSRDEAKALDNQALYAEARGDRGGIGQAQYAQIQANAMTNRRTINSARTKLATDTARQIADLRSQGEFQKADAVLQLTQTYLAQLMDLEKWSAEFNLSVDQFNTQIGQWNAEFEMAVGEMLGSYRGQTTLENQKYQTSVNQWNQEFNYNVQQNERERLASSGLAALAAGVRPSAAQQQAMGYTNAQVDAELAAYKLAQAAGVKYTGSGPKAPEPTISEKLKTFNTEAEARAYLLDQKVTEARYEEYMDLFYQYQEEKESNGGFESVLAGVDKQLLDEINQEAEGGMSVTNLVAKLERWIGEKKITPDQGDAIAESFGF